MGTYARARTNGAGIAVLPLTSTGTGTANVVVTKANFRPKETTFTITPIGGANLALSSHDIDDDGSGASSGNGDGVIDAGETIELSLSVRNGGGATANGASVTASVEPGSSATFHLTYDGAADPSKVFIGPGRTHPAGIPFTLDFANPLIAYTGTPPQTYSADSTSGERGIFLWQDHGGWHLQWGSGADSVQAAGTITTDGRIRGLDKLHLESGADAATISAGEDTLTFSGWTHANDLFDGIDVALADDTMLTITTASGALGNIAPSATAIGTVVFDVSNSARDGQIAYVDLALTAGAGGPWSGVVPVVFAGPELDAYAFTIDDDGTPPSSGDGDGVAEVGETVVLRPTVLNRGSGAAESVDGVVTASSGITFLDATDAYGSIPSLGQTDGVDGYRFTVNSGAGTTIDLTLTDSLGRTWAKPIEFVPPAAPTGLAFKSTPSAIELTWTPNGELDLAGYNVYRSTTSGFGFTQLSFELIRSGSRFADEELAFGASFYYRVTAVDNSGNEGPLSSELFAWTTLPQSPGWPRITNNFNFGSIGIVDTDDSGQGELYLGSHRFAFHAWEHDGADMLGFPIITGGEIWGTPGFGDVDKDGDEEIFFASQDSKFYAVHHDGTPVYGATPDFFLFNDFQGARGSVAIADVDHDAQLEIIIGTDWGRLFAFDHDGTAMNGSNPLLFSVSPLGANSRIWGSIAVGDIDNDGTREIGFCSWNDSLYVIEPDGTLEPGFPKGATLNYRSGPVFADLDADGTKEVIAGNDDGKLYAYNHDGSNYAPGGILASMPFLEGGVRCLPAVANIDGDPQLEIFVSCMDGNLYGFQHNGTGILNPNGLFVDIEPTALGFSASPIVVDVDGDSDMEILVGHRNGNFYGFHHDGTGIVGMPIPTANEIFSTAAAGDLD
ncbi:MAG: FG-GAP-like repeat-containing protein, partial [bacterium]